MNNLQFCGVVLTLVIIICLAVVGAMHVVGYVYLRTICRRVLDTSDGQYFWAYRKWFIWAREWITPSQIPVMTSKEAGAWLAEQKRNCSCTSRDS